MTIKEILTELQRCGFVTNVKTGLTFVRFEIFGSEYIAHDKVKYNLINRKLVIDNQSILIRGI